MTPFEQAQADVKAGKLTTPEVTGEGGRKIPYFGYQLACHKRDLKLMSLGMRGMNVKLSDLKRYYGLKGRSAKDVLPQFIEIMEAYKSTI